MISFLEGKIVSTTPLGVILNVGGVGYKVEVPVTTAEKLPGIGETALIFTHPVYREDSQALYGFTTSQERDFFKLIIEKVSGIGPKIGIALMSQLSLPLLHQAIANSDAALIAKCPGIGKKTAERLCIDLGDTIKKLSPSIKSSATAQNPQNALPDSSENQSYNDAIQALIALGYKIDVADKAVRKVIENSDESLSTEEIIKLALKT